jgi:hypothetical protein
MTMDKKIWLIIAAVVVGVMLLLSMFFIPFEIGIIKEAYIYVSNEIVSVTGLSHMLVQGLVLILLAPLLWIVPILFKRRHHYNKIAWLSVLGYISVFFISLFFLSQRIYFRHDNKEVLKWFALTPDGVKYYDTPGIDPVYGIKLRPVTPEVIKRLKLLENGDFKPVDPEKVKLFDPITGDPQAWYHYTEKNGYDFYDKPGFHPMTGEPLLPVNKDVYEAWLKTKNASNAKTEIANNSIQASGPVKVDDKDQKNSPTPKKQVTKNRGTGIINDKDW